MRCTLCCLTLSQVIIFLNISNGERAVLASAQDPIRQTISLNPCWDNYPNRGHWISLWPLCGSKSVPPFLACTVAENMPLSVFFFTLYLRYKCVFVLAERIEGVLCGDCPSSVPVSYLRQWCERRQLCGGALQASRVAYATVLPGRWQKCIFGHVSTGWCIVRGWKTLQRQKIAPLASEIGVISLSEFELFRGVLSAVNI